MTQEEKFIFLRQTVERLYEVFPEVQILTSWVDPENRETMFLPMGRGNAFARKSMCLEWVDCDGIQMEADDEDEFQLQQIEREEDDERGEDISGND